MSMSSTVAALAAAGALLLGPGSNYPGATVTGDLTGVSAPVDSVGEGLSPAAKRFEVGENSWKIPSALPVDEQSIEWMECSDFNISQSDSLDCGYLIAPADYSDPDGPSVAIGLVRHRAMVQPSRGVLVVNPGGPGQSGMQWLAEKHNNLSEVLKSFDLIGMDPRGVGNSLPVIRCLSNAARDIYRAGADRAAESVEVQKQRREFQASECEKHSGEGFVGYSKDRPFLRYVGTNNVVKDVERLRRVLRVDRINFLGYSYGTTVGYLYARNYPGSTGAMVLDGNVSHREVTRSVSRETKSDSQPDYRQLAAQMVTSGGFGSALDEWMRACLAGSPAVTRLTQGCAISPVVAQPTDEQVKEGVDAIGALLSKAWGTGAYYDSRDLSRPVSAIDLAWGVRQALYSPDLWPTLNLALTSLKNDGNAGPLMVLSDAYFGRDEDGKYSQTYSALLAISCIDRALPPMANSECEPFQESDPLVQGKQLSPDIPIMNIAATQDPVTPYINGKLAARLTRGYLLTVDQTGHSMYGSVACVNMIVDAYLEDPRGFKTLTLSGTPCSLDRTSPYDPSKVRAQGLSLFGIAMIPMVIGFILWLVERIGLIGRLGG